MSELVEVSEHQHISVTASGLADFHAALAWAVQRYDQTFTAADMVKLEVEQVLECGLDDREYKTTFSAMVSGTFEPKAGSGG